MTTEPNAIAKIPEPQTTLVIGRDAGAHAQEMVEGATGIANVLAKIIEGRKLFNDISGKRHVRVEGWTTLGAMLGVMAKEEQTRRMTDGAWEARVVLIRQKDGQVVGGASGMCSPTETRWDKAADYAIRSMAITRATSKAFRMALSWIMVLAGYEATPAEEMDGVEVRKETPPPAKAKAKKTVDTTAKTTRTGTAKRYSFNDKPRGSVLAGWENKQKYWSLPEDMSDAELFAANKTIQDQLAWEMDNGKDSKWTKKDEDAVAKEMVDRGLNPDDAAPTGDDVVIDDGADAGEEYATSLPPGPEGDPPF